MKKIVELAEELEKEVGAPEKIEMEDDGSNLDYVLWKYPRTDEGDILVSAHSFRREDGERTFLIFIFDREGFKIHSLDTDTGGNVLVPRMFEHSTVYSNLGTLRILDEYLGIRPTMVESIDKILSKHSYLKHALTAIFRKKPVSERDKIKKAIEASFLYYHAYLISKADKSMNTRRKYKITVNTNDQKR